MQNNSVNMNSNICTSPPMALSAVEPMLAARLTAVLGPPEEQLVSTMTGQNLQAIAWRIGFGQQIFNGTVEQGRGTDVTILMTTTGSLVTVRVNWSHSHGRANGAVSSAMHETVEAAVAWLLADGHGQLLPSARQAWLEACEHVSTLPHVASSIQACEPSRHTTAHVSR